MPTQNTYLKLAALSAIFGFVCTATAEPYCPAPGPYAVATLKATWHDPSRNRDIPILICYPRDLNQMDQPAPVIIFSHGLGATRETYQLYGQHWASYGYVVIFPQHHGSDSAVIGHGMLQMVMGKGDTQAFLDRVKDIHFVIDQIESLDAGRMPGEQYNIFKDHLDVNRIGMSGHSFGAITTQAVAGEKFIPDSRGQFRDPRIKAAIAMSGSRSRTRDQDWAFGSIKIPMFYLTGTADKIGPIGPADRRVPFDHSTFPQTYLLVFNGATHMTFNPSRTRLGQHKEQFQSLIRQSTTAFWDAYLRHDKKAMQWLNHDFAKELGNLGVFEKKK